MSIRAVLIRDKRGWAARGRYTVEERLMDRVVALDDEDGGCWITDLSIAHNYPMIRVGGKLRKASRVAYESWIGPIPDGLEVDHVARRGCRSRLCVNPAHLEAVTTQENLRRRRFPKRDLTRT